MKSRGFLLVALCLSSAPALAAPAVSDFCPGLGLYLATANSQFSMLQAEETTEGAGSGKAWNITTLASLDTCRKVAPTPDAVHVDCGVQVQSSDAQASHDALAAKVQACLSGWTAKTFEANGTKVAAYTSDETKWVTVQTAPASGGYASQRVLVTLGAADALLAGFPRPAPSAPPESSGASMFSALRSSPSTSSSTSEVTDAEVRARIEQVLGQAEIAPTPAPKVIDQCPVSKAYVAAAPDGFKAVRETAQNVSNNGDLMPESPAWVLCKIVEDPPASGENHIRCSTNREAEGDFAKNVAATRFAELSTDTETCFPDWAKDVTDAGKSHWTTVYTSSTGVRMIIEQTVADERLTRSMEIWPN